MQLPAYLWKAFPERPARSLLPTLRRSVYDSEPVPYAKANLGVPGTRPSGGALPRNAKTDGRFSRPFGNFPHTFVEQTNGRNCALYCAYDENAWGLPG